MGHLSNEALLNAAKYYEVHGIPLPVDLFIELNLRGLRDEQHDPIG